MLLDLKVPKLNSMADGFSKISARRCGRRSDLIKGRLVVEILIIHSGFFTRRTLMLVFYRGC